MIVKNYLYNVLYQVFVLIIPIITVPYISRTLGSEGVGVYAYTNSIVSYFIILGNMGVNLYGNRSVAYVKHDRVLLSKIFWEIWFVRLFFVALSTVLWLIFISIWGQYHNIMLLQTILLISTAFDISWFFMGLEDFKKTVMRNSLVKLVAIFLIFSLVRNRQDLSNYVLIINLSALVGNLLLFPYLRKYISLPKLGEIKFRNHISQTILLFIPQVATQVYLVLNKTMLGALTTVENAGFYENSDKLVKIILAIITATGTVMLPRISTMFSEGSDKKVIDYLFGSFDFVTSISFPMALGLAAIAPKFSPWFFGNQFLRTAEVIPILSISIIFVGWSNVLGVQYLLPTNRNRDFTISVIIGGIVNLFSNIILIRKFGLLGAAFSSVISEFAVTLTQMILIRNDIIIFDLLKDTWKYLLSSLVMYFSVSFLHMRLSSTLKMFIFQIIIGVLIYCLTAILLKAPIIHKISKFRLKHLS